MMDHTLQIIKGQVEYESKASALQQFFNTLIYVTYLK